MMNSRNNSLLRFGLVAVVFSLVLLLSACGGSDAEKPYIGK